MTPDKDYYTPAHGYTQYSDGWKTPSDGTYRRSDGSTFTVPVKTYKDPFTGGTVRTYGGYTQSELHKFSEEAQKSGK